MRIKPCEWASCVHGEHGVLSLWLGLFPMARVFVWINEVSNTRQVFTAIVITDSTGLQGSEENVSWHLNVVYALPKKRGEREREREREREGRKKTMQSSRWSQWLCQATTSSQLCTALPCCTVDVTPPALISQVGCLTTVCGVCVVWHEPCMSELH